MFVHEWLRNSEEKDKENDNTRKTFLKVNFAQLCLEHNEANASRSFISTRKF